MGIVELTPFLFSEIHDPKITLPTFWLKGGYPDAVREKKESRWQRWQENYVRTFIERDIPRLGPRISSIQMRRLMGMLAHHHGGLPNTSDLGRSLGVSSHTVSSYLDILEGHCLIRLLPPLHLNIGKRLVKSPKVYIRDPGVLHSLLGISSERNLLESPRRGDGCEGMMIEQVVAMEPLRRPGSGFYFYRTHAGRRSISSSTGARTGSGSNSSAPCPVREQERLPEPEIRHCRRHRSQGLPGLSRREKLPRG